MRLSRELAKRCKCCRVPDCRSFLYGAKRSKIPSALINGDIGAPLICSFPLTHSLVSAGRMGRNLSIEAILRMSCQPQVLNSIIRLIAVYVVKFIPIRNITTMVYPNHDVDQKQPSFKFDPNVTVVPKVSRQRSSSHTARLPRPIKIAIAINERIPQLFAG